MNPFDFDKLASGYAAILDMITGLMMRMEKTAGSRYDTPRVSENPIYRHASLAVRVELSYFGRY